MAHALRADPRYRARPAPPLGVITRARAERCERMSGRAEQRARQVQGKPVGVRRCPATVFRVPPVSRNTCLERHATRRGLRATESAAGGGIRGAGRMDLMNSSTLLRAAPRAVGAAALFGAMLAVPVGAVAAPAPAGEACVGDEGVTVVVDFTDLGGEIEVACAEGAPDSGREALEAAGFTPEDSEPGMICTIDDQPDPCPEEFDGNFWSYWHAEAGGDWESYMVGADESEPAPGEIEGWRYSTGEEGPQITPAALLGEDAGEDGDTGAS